MGYASLATLRGNAYRLADMSTTVTADASPADVVNSGFIPVSEMNQYINYGYRKLYGLLTMTNEKYFYSYADTTLVAGQEDYDLPVDFWILLGVDLLPAGVSTSGTRITLFEFTWADRNKFRNYAFSLYGRHYEWHIIGNQFRIVPLPGGANDAIRLHYVPDITLLTTDTQYVITEPQFDEFISTYAAKIMLDKEESDSTAITARLANLEQDIIHFAQARQTCNARPISVVEDTYKSQLLNPYASTYGDYY